MQAALFFRMVSHGRKIEHRRKYREFYELCRVAQFPDLTQDSKREYATYLWDESLSEWDLLQHEKFKRESATRAEIQTRTFLDMMKRRSGGAHRELKRG